MLKLRRGRVSAIEHVPDPDRLLRLAVDVGGEQRPAIAYPALTGPVELGDEVVVNVEARDLGLGSGGFDILYVNLTRGLEGEPGSGAHVMKLNYTPLQHAVLPLEEELEQMPPRLGLFVAVLPLHGHLPAAAFALAKRAPGFRVGYVQTAGGALTGQLSETVARLCDGGLLSDHVTVASSFGGRSEAITLEGALHAGAERLGWEAALVGPGPGILGSASALGHGGMEALHSAHSSLSLGCPVTLSPRLSSGDVRERHRGLSHHTRTVLSLLLRPVEVPVPSGISEQGREALREALSLGPGHAGVPVDVEGLVAPYRESGLPVETMGRSFEQDEDFFLAGLAAGAALARRFEEVD